MSDDETQVRDLIERWVAAATATRPAPSGSTAVQLPAGAPATDTREIGCGSRSASQADGIVGDRVYGEVQRAGEAFSRPGIWTLSRG